MNKTETVIVVGLGEVGRPILELFSGRHRAIGVDLEPPERPYEVDVLHVCYPFEIADFVGETERYIEFFTPALTIIHSTVAVGTTRAVAERTGAAVVNSPVRGKHACMLAELRSYTKFLGGIEDGHCVRAADHFASVGVTTTVLATPEATELAKLSETTYFGVLIAWAQEVERYCDRAGANYDEVVSFYQGIGYLPPVKFFPGVIGGHCVMPNIEILSRWHPSFLLDAIRHSNQSKVDRETAQRELASTVTSPRG